MSSTVATLHSVHKVKKVKTNTSSTSASVGLVASFSPVILRTVVFVIAPVSPGVVIWGQNKLLDYHKCKKVLSWLDK